MPRSSYTPKNRFCHNSNQSEWTYLKVLFLWLRGETISGIESQISHPSFEFEWIMEQLETGKKLENVPKREEPVSLSRQAIHKIIDRFAEHIIELRYRDKIRHFKTFASNPKSLADHSSLSSFPFVRRVLSVAERFGALSWLSKRITALDWKEEKSSQAIRAWELASGNIDPNETRPIFKIGSREAIFPPMVVRMVQQRYRDYRGFNPEKMDSHLAFDEIITQAVRYLYKKHPVMAKKHPSEMSDEEIEHQRINIAMNGLQHVIADLLQCPVGTPITEDSELH